jgi:hypothetical protein
LAGFPIRWSQEQLQEARTIAERRFVLERQGEGPDAFHETCRKAEPQVRQALAKTADLQNITGEVLLAHPPLWQMLRYFCAPPISEEDLWTLVGQKFKTISLRVASPTAEALASVVDVFRFPWVAAKREPTDAEREAAVLATTILYAHESLKTTRRGSASRAQEVEVSTVLVAAGLTLDPSRKPILRLDDLPRHHFSRERKVDGAKCDIPVKLADGRLLALECKVSNGPKNSWKRLQREVGGKSERWRQEFGNQVITGALLAGVFDLKCLATAQNEQQVFLFWQHDIGALIDFIKSLQR